MEVTATKEVRLDYVSYIVLMQTHITNYNDWFGTGWDFPIPPTFEFLENLMLVHAKEVCERAMIQRLRCNKEGNYIDQFFADNFPHVHKSITDKLMVEYMTLIGAEWQNEITKFVGINGFDIWKASLSDGFINLLHDGDFRILEWEQDHLLDGVYVSTPIVRG